jgi:hypothetical protein
LVRCPRASLAYICEVICVRLSANLPLGNKPFAGDSASVARAFRAVV